MRILRLLSLPRGWLRKSDEKPRSGEVEKIEIEPGRASLRIYVSQHCWSCEEALRLADLVKTDFPEVSLEIVDFKDGEGANPDGVFAVPTYVLDGRIISLGNPSAGELFTRLSKALGDSEPEP